mgnify:CR=1 FL=1
MLFRSEMYKKGIGTLAYQDAWGLFDQIIISSSWLNKEQNGFFFYKQHIFNKEFLIENNVLAEDAVAGIKNEFKEKILKLVSSICFKRAKNAASRDDPPSNISPLKWVK